MWKTIKYALLIVVCIILLPYILYKYEEKILVNNDINQLKFNYVLLKELDQGKNKQVAVLLSADIQRTLININVNHTTEYINKLCNYMNEDNINLLKKYDKNISIEHLNKIMTHCKNSSSQLKR